MSRWVASAYKVSDGSLAVKSSVDGINWQYIDLSDSFHPATDVIATALYYFGGVWYLVYVTSDGGLYEGTSFDIASSTDCKTWVKIATVDCSSLTGINAAWATCFFLEPDATDYTGIHIFGAWSPNWPTDTGFSFFEVHPTNAGLTAWSVPVQVTGTGFPNNMIDPFVVKIGSTYHMLFKNENAKFLGHATSSALTSGWTVLASGATDTLGMGTGEAPQATNTGGSNWMLHWDDYVAEVNYYATSADDLTSFSGKTAVGESLYRAHPGVFYTTDAEAIRDIIKLGRAAHWQLQDNAASTTVVATVGTNATLTNAGNTSASSVSGPGIQLPLALSLDGSNDVISDGQYADVIGSNSRSIALWFKTSEAGNQGLWDIGTINSDNQGWSLFVVGNNGIGGSPPTNPGGLYLSAWNKDLYLPIGVAAVCDGAWHHVAVVYDGITQIVSAYLDGIELTGTTYKFTGSWASVTMPHDYGANLATSQQNVLIGNARQVLWSNGDSELNGSVADVWLLKSVLSLEDVGLIIDEAGAPPTITSDGGGATATLTPTEGAVNITTVTADGTLPMWFSVDCPQGQPFAINSAGLLTFPGGIRQGLMTVRVGVHNALGADYQDITTNVAEVIPAGFVGWSTAAGRAREMMAPGWW